MPEEKVETKQLLKSGLISKEREKGTKAEELLKAGFIQEEKEKPFQAELKLILKQIEENKKLLSEEKDYLHLYLSLENFIIDNLRYTTESLRADIKERFNVHWFSPRLRALFTLKDPDNLIFSLLFLESILKHLSHNLRPEAIQRTINDITRNRLINNIIITEEKIDLSAAERKIFSDGKDFSKVTQNINKTISALYTYSTNKVGVSQTKQIFSATFNELNIKYSKIPKFIETVKTLPQDILEEERLELLTKEELEKVSKRLARIDVMKSEFTNIAAHELGTPLTPIIIHLDSMVKNKKSKISKEEKEKLKICLRNAKRLDSLVDEILDISKLEAGEMKFDMGNINIIKLIKHTKQDLGPSAIKKGLKLITNIPRKLPMVKGDEKRLMQVMENLVKNAIKFTDKGSVTISAKQIAKNIEVRIKDTGVGIDKEDTLRVFTKFFQAEPAATRRKKGTGLGLAISKAIIEAHKGNISVESEKGKGSVFKFKIPKATR